MGCISILSTVPIGEGDVDYLTVLRNLRDHRSVMQCYRSQPIFSRPAAPLKRRCVSITPISRHSSTRLRLRQFKVLADLMRLNLKVRGVPHKSPINRDRRDRWATTRVAPTVRSSLCNWVRLSERAMNCATTNGSCVTFQ